MARLAFISSDENPVFSWKTAVGCFALAALACPLLAQQVILVNTAPGPGAAGSIDRRYAQIEPTKVDLPHQPIDARGHQDILRILVAEQGFAMRPLPRGKKGLTLTANGKLSPVGPGYVNQITEQGLSVKPGDRVVLSNVRIDKERIVFDINGGPDRKHEFLRHVQVGMGGPGMTNPVVQDDGQEPTGARITLAFDKFVPEVSPAQIKALLAPLISFDMKTPVQAYTDTLPPTLKKAILGHHVLVGMNTDMVLFALGQPESKSREVEGQMPFEEWIYGHPPGEVQFVRINGNRVIRVEIAKMGQPLEVFTRDEVEGLMTTDGRPVLAEATHTVEMGDVHRNPDTQAPAAPPTLRAPGETLPSDEEDSKQKAENREGAMKPVVFPRDTTKDPARTVDAHPAAAKPEATTPDKKTSDSAAPANPDATKLDSTKKDGSASAPPTAPDGADSEKPPSSPNASPAQPAPHPVPPPTPNSFLEARPAA
jgi:hypothetical protein